MKAFTKTLVIITLLLAGVLSSGCAKKHAVLISANNVTVDDVAYHSVWWYDLFQQYKMLRKNGFKDNNIHVLFGNGTDFNTAYAGYNATTQYGHAITDMAANKANVQAVFSNIQSNVKSRDFLYVWWMGHGLGYGSDYCDLTMDLSHTGEHVTDVEFAGYVNVINNYRKRNVNIMTCHAGGMLDNFDSTGNKTMTLTSSTCAESSYEAFASAICDGRHRAEFNMTLTEALREQDACGTTVASDTNADGYVSYTEAHQYNQAEMVRSTPQIEDPDSLAGGTQIKKKQP
jgi:hypothetical protein